MNDDIFEQARQKVGPGVIHALFNSPGSYSQGGRYFLLSPLRADNSVGSFSIDEQTGLWHDKAGDDGGDFITLVARTHGIKPIEAAKMIIKESGAVFVESSGTSKKREKKDYPEPMIIADSVALKESLDARVKDKWIKEHWGKAEKATLYRNEKGEGVFYVVRFVKPNKKDKKKRDKNDILFYLGTDNRWYTHWHEKLKPFPLLGIDQVKKNKLPCLIVEGEKCGRVDVPGYNVVTWVGGSANVRKSDWSKLKGRDCLIWPDADSEMDKNKEFFLPRENQPGMKAAYYIKSLLPKAKILEVYRYKPVEDNPGGWDIADYVEEGGEPLKFIKDFSPYNSLSVEIDPYSVYRAFIDHYYDHDSLEQVNGGYWQYRDDLHYWQQVLKNDLICNFQRWLEETGLQWVISKKVKATKFINEVKQYLDRHSLGYFSQNPFKDSAMSPFIHMNNGAVKIRNGEFEWYDRDSYGEDFFKNLFPIHCLDFSFDNAKYTDLNPERDCPGFYFFVKEMIPREEMEKCESDEAREALIIETLYFLAWVIAYSLSPKKPNEYFFGIYGNQRTGKSFMLDIIRSIVGAEFCIERQISDLDNRFASSGFWGKKVYIEPDLKTRQPLPEGFIKSYAGEQTISMEEKNKPTVDGVKTSISMFFISNYEFHARGIEGLARRLILIPYKNDIKKHDTKLLGKILGKYPHGEESGADVGKTFDERPAILALALKAWEKFCNEDDYLAKPPAWANTEKEIWLLESNTVEKFLEEDYFIPRRHEVVLRNALYEEYKNWCTEDGRKPLGKKNFYEEVRRNKFITENRNKGFDNFNIGQKYESQETAAESESSFYAPPSLPSREDEDELDIW